MIELKSESQLRSLQVDQIEESLTLDFKRTLDLSTREKKAEAAKDVSALANTAGGQIVYGVDEKSIVSGAKVAGGIFPLTDNRLQDSLRNVLISAIHPRPQFEISRVDVDGGHVLVVQVYPSLGGDVHMVEGYGQSRFYKRSGTSSAPMSEPEVREAYMQVAARRGELDQEIQRTIDAETKQVPKTQESVFVVPIFGHRGVVNPQKRGREFGNWLVKPFYYGTYAHLLRELRICSDGYRGRVDVGKNYAAVLRQGCVHIAMDSERVPTDGVGRFGLSNSFQQLLVTLDAARMVLLDSGYWGPVRVVHQLRARHQFYLIDAAQGADYEVLAGKSPVSPGTYNHISSEAVIGESPESLRLIAREVMDQIWQTSNEPACQWFNSDGELAMKQGHAPPEATAVLVDPPGSAT